MFDFGIRTILTLLITGGIIAVVGDYIGKSIGRKRLTVFKLRPRHTAFMITIITGMLISLITVGVVLSLSQDTRIALFGLDELKKTLNENKQELVKTRIEKEKIDRELAQANISLAKAKLEIATLETSKQKLSERIEASRKGTVIFKVGEVLVVSLIKAGPEIEKLESGLKQILSAADAHVRSFGIDRDNHLIILPPEEFEQAIVDLQISNQENIVKVIAARNTLFGEEVPVRLEVTENKLIYKAGEAIAQTEILPSLPIPGIEQEIKKLLIQTNLLARESGVEPDADGSLGSLPYSEILSEAKRIKTYKKELIIKTIAKSDIQAIGPLKIEFKAFYK